MKKDEVTNQSPRSHVTQAGDSSCQVQLNLKKRICLSRSEMSSVELIMSDYSIAKPRWLRLEFKTTLQRTKFLIGILTEAGVGSEWCQFVSPHDCWDTHAHSAWHKLVGRECNGLAE